MWNLEVFAEDGAGFVLHEEKGAVGVGLGDFLEEGEEADGCMEEPWGVGLDGGCWEGCGGVAEFVDGGFC